MKVNPWQYLPYFMWMQSARTSLGKVTRAQANVAAKLNAQIKPITRFKTIITVYFHLSCSPNLVNNSLLCTLLPFATILCQLQNV